METYIEDDWENIEIPEITANVQLSIKSKERELKLLEERKQMEKDDIALVEDLFLETIKDKLEPVRFIKHKNIAEAKFVKKCEKV